jgi:membrane protease YdiL (CAAX protease family)
MAIFARHRVCGALLRAAALSLFVLLAVYVPAFAVFAGFRLPLDMEVPVVMVVTLALACFLIGVFARRYGLHLADFGFRLPPRRYLLYSLAFAAPLGAVVAWVLSRFSEPGPLGGLHLAPGLVYLYFVVGAPIQEEVIFRGLLQTTLAKNIASVPELDAASGTAASLAIAAVFGTIHLAVGPLTALGALVLGVLAGELRRRSGSLFPGVVCHLVFNLEGILWALSDSA